jgi:type I restriction enzyme S subunit
MLSRIPLQDLVMNRCTQTTIGEVCEVFDGPHATPKKLDSGPIFLSISSLVDGRLDLSHSAHISEEDFVKWTKRVTPRKNDLLFSYETRLGDAALVPDGLKCCLGRRLALMRIKDPEQLDSRYLLYYYLSSTFQNFLKERTVFGSTVNRIPLKEVPDFPLSLPDLKTQKAIAHILGTLDDKIEINQKMNQTLEEIAQAIFKSWFVDFDPVRAKAEGRPTGLPPELSDLFPDELVDSEIGKIPKGWDLKNLGDLVIPKKGKSITKNTAVEGDVPVVAGGLSPAYYHNTSNVKAPVVTISASGANAGFARLYNEDIWASDCSYISEEQSPFSVLWYVFFKINQKKIYHMQQGAAQPHIYPSDLMRLKLAHPIGEKLWYFASDIISPIFKKIGISERETKVLSDLRDTLLPKLISGELRIPDAEKFIADAGI